MYILDLDQSTEKALERRRSAEAARKARIYNTRQRVMGVDLDGLNQQVQERKHQQNIEKQRDKAFDVQRIFQDQTLLQQDMNEKEKRKALQKDLIQHWATQVGNDDHLDAYLKSGLRGAVKFTMPEADLGPASMQIFQMLVQKNLLFQDQRRIEQAAQEDDCKRSIRITLANYNQALAAEQAKNLECQHRREERENLAEISHTLTSDMMTECAEAAERDMGDGKLPQIMPDRWKGMRPEQLSTIYREQEQQRLERQRQSEAEKFQAAAWDLQLLNLSRKTEEEERRAAELRRERRLQVDQFNMQLAREQRANQEFLNKKLYTNKPTKEYFKQFNRSSR